MYLKKAVNIFLVIFLLPEFAFISLAQTQPNYSSDQLYNETMSVVEKVKTINNYAGNSNVDSTSVLPFGIIKEIGTTRYIIAIDSAVFAADKATYSAYMALDFPGSTERIAFAGKNLAFNPKGIIPGNNTRLMLASDQKINIGPKVKLVLKADGTNYIEWDCNGFKAIRLKGSFEFNNTMLVPDPSFSSDSTVKATFDIYTSDVHNFIAQIGITPFSIKGLKDVFFTVSDATVDMSEIANPSAMVFPVGYNLANAGSNLNMWTGFYMKQFKIKLPKEISKNNTPMEIYASNFFIDKSGVTGNFQATNLFSTGESSMSGWGFSIDQLGVNFVSNNLNGGNIAGKVLLPLNNVNGISYSATVFQNLQTEQTDYSFSISPVTDYTASVFSAVLDIYPTSKITIQKANGILKPTAELNGKISFAHADMKSPALDMQHVVLSTEAPYLISGVFGFTSGSGISASLAGFNISFNSITAIINSASPGIGFNAGLSFTSDSGSAFGAAATFNIMTALTNNPDPKLSPKWKFDRVDVNNIALDIHTTAFQFDGFISFRNHDPVYGKGFFGSLNFMLTGVMQNPATAHVCFGAKNTFKYFYVDLAIPLTIVVMPPTPTCPQGIALYRFMGGLYSHMKPMANNSSAQMYGGAFGSAQSYVPDSTIAVGVKAGVTLGTYPVSQIFNGDIALEINFTSSGGLGMIKFSGTAFMFVKIEDRVPTPKATIPVRASVSILFDHQNNIFHSVINVDVNLQAVKAHGQSEFHVDPNVWYITFGKPQNRVSIEIYGIATLSSYLMLGNQIDPMPPPPNQVMNVFGHGFADTRDGTKLSGGTGFVLGACLSVNSSGAYSLGDFSLYYDLGMLAGFDVMAFNYGSKAHCSGTTATAGFNGWYAEGDLYTALWGAIGAKGTFLGADFDIQLMSVSAAAMLNAKFPNPSHIQGAVAVSYDILQTFKGSYSCSFEKGTQCNITN